MWLDTFSQGGGRELGNMGGGKLYEVASLQEKKRAREEMDSSNAFCIPGSYPVKRSVEGARVQEVRLVHRFICDGAMYRHTKHKRSNAPFECRQAHVVQGKKGKPAGAVRYEHMIEDLTPFDRDVYWETVWVKCLACHSDDVEFEAWARRRSDAAGGQIDEH